MTAFRNLAQTHAHDFMGRFSGNILAFKGNLSGFRLQQTGNRMQRGGFSGSVGTDQGGDAAFGYRQADAFDCMDRAIINVDILNCQHVHRITPPRPDML